jgi:trk system potassium uptake protein TrkA
MRIIVAGIGVLGRALVGKLVEHKQDVVAIDIDGTVCDALYADLGAVVVQGSATDLHVLQEAGGADADMVVALMHRDSDNVACALLARSLGVSRVIARLQDPSYEDSYRTAGITSIVRSTELLQQQILLHIEHPQVLEVMSVRGEAKIYSLDIPETSAILHHTIAELAAIDEFPRECLILGILRKGSTKVLIPHGADRLMPGDTVLVISDAATIGKAVKLLAQDFFV